MVTVQEISKIIRPVLKRHHVEHAAVFGSFARGEQTEQSDLDLLIEFEPHCSASLLDMAGLKVDLEDHLGRVVDVVSVGARLHPSVRQTIEESQIPVL